MSTIEKIKILLGIAKQTFGKVTTDKLDVFFDGDTLTAETRVYNEEGNPIEDGEYSTEDKIYIIVDSVVKEVRPKETETEETEKVTETTETKTEETTEEKTEMADETITEEITEEVRETITEPTIDERVSALEEVVETLFNEIREMRARETEQTNRNTEIIREFASIKRSPTAESITKAKDNEKCFSDCTSSKAERLKQLKGKK